MSLTLQPIALFLMLRKQQISLFLINSLILRQPSLILKFLIKTGLVLHKSFDTMQDIVVQRTVIVSFVNSVFKKLKFSASLRLEKNFFAITLHPYTSTLDNTQTLKALQGFQICANPTPTLHPSYTNHACQGLKLILNNE